MQDKLDKINRWLRYHSNYQVTIQLLAIYGCISIDVTKDGDSVYFNIGENLEKRLDEVLALLPRLEARSDEETC